MYATAAKDEIALEFDQPVAWHDRLANQFYLDGQDGEVASGRASGSVLVLKLRARRPPRRSRISRKGHGARRTCFIGTNGIAALTFCDVPLAPAKPKR